MKHNKQKALTAFQAHRLPPTLAALKAGDGDKEEELPETAGGGGPSEIPPPTV